MRMLTHRLFFPALVLMVVLVLPACSGHARKSTAPPHQMNKEAADSTKKGLVMKQVRAFIAPASARNGAVFMDVINHTPEQVTITGAATPVSRRAELHTHKNDNGVMKMRPAESFVIDGNGGTYSLKPGGDHIMLLKLTTPLREGQQFPLTLKFADRKAQAVTVHVVKPGGRVPDTQ